MTCRVCGMPEGEGQCQDCRSLANEIRINSAILAALRDEVLPAEPARVHPQRVFWRGAAAAAVLIALALPLNRFRPTTPLAPAGPYAAGTKEPLRVKILTPDPDVVIYWLIDSKENVTQ